MSALVDYKRIVKIGDAYYISIDKEWLKAHGINPRKVRKLLVVADLDYLIVNPAREEEVYKEVSKVVGAAKLSPERGE